MAHWHEFSLRFVQAAIFTPEHSGFSSTRAVATVLSQFQGRFDGELQVLPLPPEIPPEVDRVVLESKDASRRLSMAPARLDSVWQKKDDTLDFPLQRASAECVEVLQHYVSQSKARVGRLGLVTRRICRVENPAEVLIRRFCNDDSQREPLNRSESFELHNHKVYQPLNWTTGTRINSWVRCKSASLGVDNQRAIFVEQDLNTMAVEVESRRFTADEIGDFFRMASKEADEILQKYFPE
jgi:hypothetical protein